MPSFIWRSICIKLGEKKRSESKTKICVKKGVLIEDLRHKFVIRPEWVDIAIPLDQDGPVAVLELLDE